jgi:cation diffusion facilitator CzcD-associated flavoprotein CzcO
LATKHLKDKVDNLYTFECKSEVGGLWNFSEETIDNITKERKESDVFLKEYGTLQSSIYKSLTTNIPTVAMHYKDFYPKDTGKPFMTSKEFHDYLKDYSVSNGLYDIV